MRLSCFIVGSSLLGLITTSEAYPQARDTVKRSLGVPGDGQSFDYLIVGGGTAGLTIASRLAEDPLLSVAVIEAGGFYEDAGNTSVIPAYDVFFAGTAPTDTNPAVDWGFVTTPQKASSRFRYGNGLRSKIVQGANNRRIHYARGKTLGGTSARNVMYYHRQNIDSAKQWAKETGDQSYTFENLLPFYEKSVKYTPPSSQVYTDTTNEQDSTIFSANRDPLQVSGGDYSDPFSTWALQALRATGQKAIKGFQSGFLIGSGYTLHTIDPLKGIRSSSESSFLPNALKETTLTVFNNTLSQKILFTDKTATGVLCTSGPGSTSYTLTAKRQIILSAGAFQSPQLLMVSGIRPLPTLLKHHIPIIQPLPGVGANLQDQPFFGSAFRVSLSTFSTALNNRTLATIAAQL